MLSRAWPFEAYVEGTDTYRTTLSLVGGELQGDCSCPVGVDCKHAAALALRVADDNRDGSSPRTELNQWLATLTDRPAPKTLKASAHKIFYVLRENETGIVVFEVCRAPLRRNGTLGKTTVIDYPANWIYNQRSVDDQVRRLILTLDSNQPREATGRWFRTDHFGPHIYKQLVATRLLFWGASASPLTLGEPRVDTLAWHADSKESYRVGCQSQVAIASGDAPHYIDPATGQIGPLDLGVSPAIVSRLVHAPPIDKAVFPDVARSLGTVLGVEISTTEKLKPQKIPLERRAVIRLESSGAGGRLDVSLNAAYGERVYPMARSSVDDGPRDLSAEADALAFSRKVLDDLSDGGMFFGDEESQEFAARITSDIAPALKAEGWTVELSEALDAALPVIVDDVVGAWEELDGGGWFQFSLGVEVAGETRPLLPILLAALADPKQPIDLAALKSGGGNGLTLTVDGESIYIPRRRIAEWLEPLLELQRFDLEDDGSLRLSQSALIGLAASLPEQVGMFGHAEALAEVREKVSALINLAERSEPSGFSGELRSYQRLGLAWLGALHRDGFGGILADDMGLGKTIQLLAFFEELRESGELGPKPALVVAPRSVIENWKSEAQKFTSELRCVLHHGPGRAKDPSEFEGCHIIISSYQTVVRDQALFEQIALCSLVLDEAQAIKNATTRMATTMRALKADSRFCVTGTPIENRLIELWSQFEVAMPGLLGTRKAFQTRFTGAAADLDLLRRRIRPFMLRREKREVEKSLPPKTEVIVPIEIVGKQRDLYETTRLALERQVRDSLKARGAKGSAIVVLDALLKIRQVCCDPRLVKSEAAKKVTTSAKLERLLEMLTELSAAGRATLVFSQFASMLNLIEDECAALGISTTKLTGKTRKRSEAINRFNTGEANVFLISLKAGGVGLNLTRADTVIHYDPWWNPAAEAQATDRAHRIGQDKPVFVYKLVGEGTVEERVIEMQHRKRAVADAALSHAGIEHLGADDLRALFESL